MSTLVIPNSWSTGQFVTATLENGNMNAITAVANGGIDSSNINTTLGGTPGLYASQFIPTSSAFGGNGTFGGSQTYSFQRGMNASVASTPAPVPPVYTQGGVAVASTIHIVPFFIVINAGIFHVVVSLSGSATFASASSYVVVTSAVVHNSGVCAFVTAQGANSFQVNAGTISFAAIVNGLAIGT